MISNFLVGRITHWLSTLNFITSNYEALGCMIRCKIWGLILIISWILLFECMYIHWRSRKGKGDPSLYKEKWVYFVGHGFIDMYVFRMHIKCLKICFIEIQFPWMPWSLDMCIGMSMEEVCYFFHFCGMWCKKLKIALSYYNIVWNNKF